jgi:hypothetical protein
VLSAIVYARVLYNANQEMIAREVAVDAQIASDCAW